MRIARPCSFTLIALLLYSASAFAHRPLSIGQSYPDAARALVVEELEVSQVVYAELTGQASQLWLSFAGEEGELLYLSVGIPVLERLRDFRPSLVLLGPGLPEVALPFAFAVPTGWGGLVLDTAGRADPRVFHEPITDTSSWVLLEQWVSLLRTGHYYLVAYSPERSAGKLWVALGEREAFGPADILQLPTVIAQVRQFHEVAPGPGWARTIALVAGLGLILILWLSAR